MKFEHPLFDIVIDTDDLQLTSILSKLEKVYQGIPKTKCSICPGKDGVTAECCKIFSPSMYLVEFLDILKRIERKCQIDRKDLQETVNFIIKNCVDSFMHVDKESILKKPCPLMVNNLCSYYKERPFSCRNFGLYSKVEWEKRLQTIIQQTGMKKEEIPFYEQCTGVKVSAKQGFSLTTESSNNLFNAIYNLDVQLLNNVSKQVGNITYMPFDHHFLVLFLGPDGLEQLTDMKILLMDSITKRKNNEIEEESLLKIENNIKEFIEVLKENIK